jgi:hypothetical protein
VTSTVLLGAWHLAPTTICCIDFVDVSLCHWPWWQVLQHWWHSCSSTESWNQTLCGPWDKWMTMSCYLFRLETEPADFGQWLASNSSFRLPLPLESEFQLKTPTSMNSCINSLLGSVALSSPNPAHYRARRLNPFPATSIPCLAINHNFLGLNIQMCQKPLRGSHM